MKNEARIFNTLADETRLCILMLLLSGELCVCEIIAALELSQSTLSRHLAYLKNTDWVQERKQGVWMDYQFNHNDNHLHTPLANLLQSLLSGNPGVMRAFIRLKVFRRDHLQMGSRFFLLDEYQLKRVKFNHG